MASLLEFNFMSAVNTAASVRQNAIAAATATYGGVFANLGAYQTALVVADNAFYDAVQAAATTASISPSVCASLMPGMLYGKWASITT